MMSLREMAARRVCEVRGQDPDQLGGSTRRPLWEIVATLLIDPALQGEASAAILWAREEQLKEPS